MGNPKKLQTKKGSFLIMKNYDQFLEDLAGRESGGDYRSINKKTKYLGKYQMGKLALIDARYYSHDGKKGNIFADAFWTGKDGVKSKDDFLNNPSAQENAIREYMQVQWGYLLHAGVDRYINKTRYGILVTISGALGGAHLVGWSNVGPFVKNGNISKDDNQVPITEYIEKFAGYDTPFKPRKKLTGVQKDKKGTGLRYQVDGKEWVPKGVAIQMVIELKLDGVVVTNRRGTTFLKTPPDNMRQNNLLV
jgi:hypothetical protein